MIKRLKYLLTALVAVAAAACTPSDGGAKSIAVDRTELSVGKEGMAVEVNVTANTAWTITGATDWCTLSQEAGNGNAKVTVTVAANSDDLGRSCTLAFNGSADNLPEIIVAQQGRLSQTDGLVLTASKSYIASDGKDQVEFIAIMNGKDITAESDIYMYYNNRSTKLADNVFTATANDSYKFYAISNGNISPKITITSVTKVLALPEDRQPDNYSFYRRVLAVQGTAIGCVYCPGLIQIIDDFKQTDNADRVVFTAAHTNIDIVDPMTSEGSLSVLQYLGMYSYPSLKIDFKVDLSNTASLRTINAAIAGRTAVEAKCGLSATVESVDDRIIVGVEAKNSTEGVYCIGVWLLEDGIYAVQHDATGAHTEAMDTHYNAIRAIYPYDTPDGEMLSDGSIPAKSKTNYNCEFVASKSSVANIDNCHVVVFVLGSDHSVDNVIDCPINGSVEYSYND